MYIWIEGTIYILTKAIHGTYKYELLKSWHEVPSIVKGTSINKHTFDKVIPMLIGAKLLNVYEGYNNKIIYTTTERGKILLNILKDF